MHINSIPDRGDTDFYFNLGVSDEGITLLDSDFAGVAPNRFRARGAAHTKRVWEVEGTFNDIQISIYALQKPDGGIAVKGEARKGRDRLHFKFESEEGSYLGTDHASVPSEIQQLLMTLLDPQHPAQPLCQGCIHFQRRSEQKQEAPGHAELDDFLRVTITNESWRDYYSNQITWEQPLSGIICRSDSPVMEVAKSIKSLAQSNRQVLVLGETGTGKELVARAIHELSRKSGRNMTFNCAEFDAADRMLILGKLFGYGPGHGIKELPTGGQSGVLEEARNGTIFLDEIADLPIEAQNMLLRVMDGYSFRPALGKGGELFTNARFIGATNKDLDIEVEKNNFRADFYERLRTIQISVPPLRDRLQDVAVLATYFSRQQTHIVRYAEKFFKALLWYPWPGNVRELKQFCRSIADIYQGDEIELSDLSKLPLDGRLKKGLPEAFQKYQRITQQVRIEDKEEKIICELVRIAEALFSKALAMPQKDDRQEWETVIGAAQGDFRRVLSEQGCKEVSANPLRADCFELLMACYPDEQMVKYILKYVYERLRKSKAKLSSDFEKERYDTFHLFFGRTHDVVRHWK
jgi:DNA-binding NtrC family response regulator